MSRYAADTSVSVEKSRAEIETVLGRYGADEFGYMTRDGKATIGFAIQAPKGPKWRVRFDLLLPSKGSEEFTRTEVRRNRRSADAAIAAWEQACRQRWRALALVVKAKLEAVECGITTFEEEFLAHIVLPGGRTVIEQARPVLLESYKNGSDVPLLPAA